MAHESCCPPPYNEAPPSSLVSEAWRDVERLPTVEVRRCHANARARGDVANELVYARELDFRNARARRPWLKRDHR